MTQQQPPVSRAQHDREGTLSRDSYRNRQLLLNKVKNYWISGVLEKSLHGRALLELGLEERLDAIACPSCVAWETPDEPRQILPAGTRAIDKFDQMGAGRSLLILGEPGAGKTTTLLELARELCDRAQREIFHPIPVVLNLSSWAVAKPSIYKWLVSELHAQYQIPKPVSQAWLKEQQLLLLLDGLDEVDEQYRAACVEALNQFCQDFGGTEIVACSRIADYEALSDRLRFQGALYLMPLTREQIHTYLASFGSEMAAVSTVFQQDATLRELVSTPLMLSIIALAYREMSVEELSENSSTEKRRKHLFNAYIQRMFARRRTGSGIPLGAREQEVALRWLSEIAYRMSQQSQTVFLIERIQPSWLRLNLQDGLNLPFLGGGKLKSKAYQTYTRCVQIVNGLIWALIIAISWGLVVEPSTGLINGLVGGLIIGLSTKTEPIEPAETLKWSWKKTKKWLPFAAIALLSGWLGGGLVWGLVVGASGVLLSGLMGSAVETTTVPNQGIWQSFKNAIAFTLGGIGLCLIGAAGLADAIIIPELYILSLSTFTAGIVGLYVGLSKGGKACIQHFMLRLVLYLQGYIPWNLARFLDFAAERTFLQKVGGGYIFIHRLLLEHFASLGVENYLDSMRLSPNNAENYLKRGNARLGIGDCQGAIEDYTQALEINPDLAEAYASRSRARYLLGEYAGVVEDYDRAAQINPHLAQSLTYTSRSSTDLQLEPARSSDEEVNASYSVILLNDDFNTFDRVSHCLSKYIPNMTSDRAWQLTHKVHSEGKAVVWCGRQELAALYRMQLSGAGLTVAFLEKEPSNGRVTEMKLE